jgi:hypothetical protein
VKTLLPGLWLSIIASGMLGFAAEGKDADSKIREFDIKTVQSLGRHIFEQDGYASRATDLLFEKVGGPKELTKQKIAGWIVVKQGKTVVVRFARIDGENLRPAYDIAFDSPKKGTVKAVDEKTFSDNEIAQFKARQLALRNIPKAYTPTYNTVVLPDPTGRGFLVYALAATTKANEILIGGHYRFSISETGEKILKTDPLFKSFLVIDKDAADVPKDKTEIASYWVTNLIGDHPLEMHVFLSLLHDKPFTVVTAKTGVIWVVDGDRIVKVDDAEEAGKDGAKGKQKGAK